MQIEIVSGKGGVGKSAVAAALARLHAQRGERVLAMAMVPDGGLGPHLGVRALPFVPVTGVDGVAAMGIHKAEALEQYVRIHSPVPLVAEVGRAVRVFDVLAEAAPGVREIVTVGKIAYESWEGGWDRIVVDAVPTGQLDSHLRAPEVITELIPTGRVRGQSARIRDVLAHQTQVHLVTLAEELPVVETHQATASLADLPPRLGSVMVNRLLAPPPPPVDGLPAAATVALGFHADIVAEQAVWLADLPGGPRLPYLFGADDPLLVSEFLAVTLGAWR